MALNPALAAFIAGLGAEFIFGQVFIRRTGRGFELRHVKDKECDSAALRSLAENDFRALAQMTAAGAYRPLKSAPNLQRGWRAEVRDDEALSGALNHLYPGAVADWFAALQPTPPVTSYREFTERQTGMYRITATLDTATAGAVIRACCHKDFCLKRRWWTVENLPSDPSEGKSIIPCLEPCAILLEFARKMARLEQDEKMQLVSPQSSDEGAAECDFDSPNNPRRLRFLLEKQSTPVTPEEA